MALLKYSDLCVSYARYNNRNIVVAYPLYADIQILTISEYMNDAFADSYEYIYKMVSPTLPVKYPRTPGHRPEPEENVHNAW